MIAVVQRVASASVAVDGVEIARVGRGMLILLGVLKGDTTGDADALARKISKLRIFADAQGKMNLALAQVGGEILAVSQFTLGADLKSGNRPGFEPAMPPADAEPLFNDFVNALRASGHAVHTGRFGADMRVTLVNDGPATFLLDSRKL